jgi:hypothetical protein
MYSLENLSSQAVKTGVLPWDFKPEQPIPEQIRKDKKIRDVWANNPQTLHQFYSCNEGVNSNLRISEERNDGGGNPIRCAYCLVADYDSPQPLEKVLIYAKELPYPPNRIERTLSGNWRFVFWLEEILLFPSHKFYRHFAKEFPNFAFDISKGCAGFDQKAWESANRFWANGCEWYSIHDEPISAAVTNGWLVKAGHSYKFTDKEFGPSIPLEHVKSALAEKHPGFKKWDTEFILGAQGPSFWLEGSTSPKSAILREHGIQTFAAHSAKGFYTWSDLLGADFVRNYQAAEIGRAVENIYFDGHDYWRRTPAGTWANFNKPDTILHLKTSRKLSSRATADGPSLMDLAVEHIHNMQRVAEAGPVVCRPSGIIWTNGIQKLNTSNVRVMQPAEGPPEVWGDAGNFPWVCRLSAMLPEGTARTTVIAWLAWAYQHAYRMEPVSGQVLFICGPVGVGKTLWNREIMGTIFGGFAEANSFLTGEDSFNIEMFFKYFWCLDDGTPSSDARKRTVYSHTLKRIAANSSFRVNGKFLQASMTEWNGRLCVTCNDDEESIRLIPDATVSNTDKLILIRTVKTAPLVFPPVKEIKEILSRELPHFCRYLLDYEIPAEIRGLNRFGVKPYHDSSLLEISEQSNSIAPFLEVVKRWIGHYFRVDSPEAKFWEGTATDLHRNLMLDPLDEKLLREYPIKAAQSQMRFLENAGIAVRENSKWRIYRPKGINV